jgi:hypothetical protein
MSYTMLKVSKEKFLCLSSYFRSLFFNGFGIEIVVFSINAVYSIFSVAKE